MILESAILYKTNLIDYNFAKEKLIEYIKNTFSKKGEEIVKANINALELTESNIMQITLDKKDYSLSENKLGFYETMF